MEEFTKDELEDIEFVLGRAKESNMMYENSAILAPEDKLNGDRDFAINRLIIHGLIMRNDRGKQTFSITPKGIKYPSFQKYIDSEKRKIEEELERMDVERGKAKSLEAIAANWDEYVTWKKEVDREREEIKEELKETKSKLDKANSKSNTSQILSFLSIIIASLSMLFGGTRAAVSVYKEFYKNPPKQVVSDSLTTKSQYTKPRSQKDVSPITNLVEENKKDPVNHTPKIQKAPE